MSSLGRNFKGKIELIMREKDFHQIVQIVQLSVNYQVSLASDCYSKE